MDKLTRAELVEAIIDGVCAAFWLLPCLWVIFIVIEAFFVD